MNALSAKFPNQSNIVSELNISPDIASLPIPEQGNSIRLKLLEVKVESLQNELTKITAPQSESLLLKLSFYVFSFLIWMGSIVIARILEYFTNKHLSNYN